MSEKAMQAWLRRVAASRPSAGRIRQVTDTGIVTRYVPRLAGRNVRLADGLVLYNTRAEAVEAARRVRDRIAAARRGEGGGA